jgi:poly(A) polymerase
MRKEAQKLFNIFKGKELYLVGGYVRDSILGIESDDLDFATNLLPDEIIQVLESNNLKYWIVGKAFGTISTQVDGLKIELTTYRVNEKYTKDNRHPRVEFGKHLKDDLARRDFTINALALDNRGNIVDPFNGLRDLKEHLLRTPLEPNKTFSDDPLRMIRAIRFISKFGFKIEQATLDGIISNAHKILGLSVERIKTEMDKLLVGEYVDVALQLLIETRLVNYYLPELLTLLNMKQNKKYHHKNVWEHTKLVVKNIPKDYLLKWSALLHDIAKPYTKTIVDNEIHFYNHEDLGAKLSESILRRLRFSNNEIKEITTLIANHMRPNSYTRRWADRAVRKLKNDLGEELVYKLIELSRADITSQHPDKVNVALRRLDSLIERLRQPEMKAEPKPPINGNQIMEVLGVEQGRIVGQLLKVLREAIENGLLPGQSDDDSIYYEYLKNYLAEISR